MSKPRFCLFKKGQKMTAKNTLAKPKKLEFEQVINLFKLKRSADSKINIMVFKRFTKVNRIKYTQESVLKFLGGLK